LGVGGFLSGPHPPLVEKDKAMVFTFGPNGFFGYCGSKPEETMWWSTCEAPIPEKLRKLDPEELRAQLQKRHRTWKDTAIRSILEKAQVDSIYPTWTTPLLPHWGTNSLILVGDAAHGLQPTSGQGSSQALEDSKTLSLLLANYLSKTNVGGCINDAITVHEACNLTSKAYYEIRGSRIEGIVKMTAKIANTKKDMSTAQELLMYLLFWLMGNLPISVSKSSTISDSPRNFLVNSE
jgi:2-polyprenyl-6-methoxyphenol hydroxylase-like FAD-dependent oxidoreductase